jgi:hypothetical protein
MHIRIRALTELRMVVSGMTGEHRRIAHRTPLGMKIPWIAAILTA